MYMNKLSINPNREYIHDCQHIVQAISMTSKLCFNGHSIHKLFK